MQLTTARASAEDLAHLGMHREVGVALAVAHLRVGQPAEGLRALVRLPASCRAAAGAGLGEQRHSATRTRDLAGAGRNSVPRDADVVVRGRAAAPASERRRPARPAGSRAGSGRSRSSRCANAVLPCEPERRRAGRPPPPSGPSSPIASVVGRQRLGGGVRALEAVGERRDAQRLEGVALLAPGRLDVAALGSPARSCRLAPVLLEVRLDERVEVAVHHPLHVAHLELGAVVVDHGVRLEHVGADLVAPGVVGLGGLDLAPAPPPAPPASAGRARRAASSSRSPCSCPGCAPAGRPPRCRSGCASAAPRTRSC